uniref:Non-specific serine/threonine protein kinase n=1 Tax=Alexandrium monilatum TaxID=311494 RepID=A0A7S4Q2U6_9DINO
MAVPQQPAQRGNTTKSIGHYVLGKTIGEGTFGKVKLGRHILSGERVAVKILEKEKIVEVADVERIAREVHILKLIRHPHIVQLYEIIETRGQLYLIMEYASGGELFDYIVAHGRVQEAEACRFFHQIIAGVEKVHAMNVVHRDLKPENLLLDEHKCIKIVDFGLSNVFREGQLLQTACGSPCYAPPEMVAGMAYVPGMCDLWSCGVILFALVCGYLPFEDQNTNNLYTKILAADYTAPAFISKSVKELIAGLLTVDPNQRYTIAHVRAHPWYRQVPESSVQPRELAPGQLGLDEDVLRELDAYGFPREYAVRCLELNKHNHLTTTYYLLVDKRRRVLEQLSLAPGSATDGAHAPRAAHSNAADADASAGVFRPSAQAADARVPAAAGRGAEAHGGASARAAPASPRGGGTRVDRWSPSPDRGVSPQTGRAAPSALRPLSARAGAPAAEAAGAVGTPSGHTAQSAQGTEAARGTQAAHGAQVAQSAQANHGSPPNQRGAQAPQGAASGQGAQATHSVQAAQGAQAAHGEQAPQGAPATHTPQANRGVQPPPGMHAPSTQGAHCAAPVGSQATTHAAASGPRGVPPVRPQCDPVQRGGYPRAVVPSTSPLSAREARPDARDLRTPDLRNPLSAREPRPHGIAAVTAMPTTPRGIIGVAAQRTAVERRISGGSTASSAKAGHPEVATAACSPQTSTVPGASTPRPLAPKTPGRDSPVVTPLAGVPPLLASMPSPGEAGPAPSKDHPAPPAGPGAGLASVRSISRPTESSRRRAAVHPSTAATEVPPSPRPAARCCIPQAVSMGTPQRAEGPSTPLSSRREHPVTHTMSVTPRGVQTAALGQKRVATSVGPGGGQGSSGHAPAAYPSARVSVGAAVSAAAGAAGGTAARAPMGAWPTGATRTVRPGVR